MFIVWDAPDLSRVKGPNVHSSSNLYDIAKLNAIPSNFDGIKIQYGFHDRQTPWFGWWNCVSIGDDRNVPTPNEGSFQVRPYLCIYIPRYIFCCRVLGSHVSFHACAGGRRTWAHVDQGLTKARLKRGQMALGVFPNCRECQKIDFPVLKNPSAIY